MSSRGQFVAIFKFSIILQSVRANVRQYERLISNGFATDAYRALDKISTARRT